MLAIGIGSIWFSIERGRLVYSGSTNITRDNHPIRFWFGIAYAAAWCCALIAIVGYGFINSSNTNL